MTFEQVHQTLMALRDVQTERVVQHRRWGEQNHPDISIDPHGVAYFGDAGDSLRLVREWEHEARDNGGLGWDLILLEELVEVFEAAIDGRTDDVEAELVQVAAVAVAWVEAIRRRSSL